MGFLNSAGLWGGLAAAGIAVPIIIHLLYRKHRNQTDWAAMELLRRALVVRSGQVKFEDYLILALRCLALLLIAAALLRPTLNSSSTPWLGEKKVGMVVAVDSSYSMNHGLHSRYEKAIETTRKILGEAKQGDPVSLVLMSNQPEILLRRAGYDEARFAEALDAQKAASPYRLSLERNLEQLEELVDELKTPARECYLVTDAQAQDWAELSEQGRETLNRLTKKATVFVVPVSADGEENISLVSLKYASGALRKSGVARFNAEVRNLGRRPGDGGTLEFFVEDELVTRRTVGSLDAGETRVVSFFSSFDEAGDVRLKARLVTDHLTDDLADDNERFAVVSIRPEIRVLCVDDDAAESSELARSGSDYAVVALRLKDRESVESPLQVHQIPASDLSLETLNDFDVILLAGVKDLAPEMVARLERFVQRGGGLIVFLGEGIDAKQYNQRFADLLPATLGDTLAAEEDSPGWAIGPVDSDHRLAAIVKRLPTGLANTARFSKVVQVEPTGDTQTILKIAEQGAPLLLSRDVGAGTVLMFTTSADRTWNQLAIHPLYTILLQQAVTNLTSQPDGRQILVGEPADVAVRGREVGDEVKLTDPRGDDASVRVTQANQKPVCAIETRAVGVYELAGSASIPAVAVAANVDPAESDVRVIDARALKGQLDTIGVQVVEDSTALEKAIEKGRQGRELATLFLTAGIVVFLLQSFLAKYFTNRMRYGESDVSASLLVSRVAAARRS